MRACMFTGHRQIRSSDMKQLPEWLDARLEEMIEAGYTEFCAGGAIGFDTFAALKIIEKKNKYGFIKLNLYLPCHNQEKAWSDGLKRAYYYVLKNADTIRYASEEYTPWCMLKRNREMVDDSDVCLAYCRSASGGSRYTLSYAEKKGLKIVNFCN